MTSEKFGVPAHTRAVIYFLSSRDKFSALSNALWAKSDYYLRAHLKPHNFRTAVIFEKELGGVGDSETQEGFFVRTVTRTKLFLEP